MLSRVVLVSLLDFGLAAVRCGGQIPLQRLGANLFCGPGSVACPLGSYCHIDVDAIGRFAVCCPNPAPVVNLVVPATTLYASPPVTTLYVPPVTRLYATPPAAPAAPLYVSPPVAPLYTSPANPLYNSPPIVPDSSRVITVLAPAPEPVLCPDSNKQRLNCPINTCLTVDCFGVPGASCMVDYCGNCGPKWYGPNNRIVTVQECNQRSPFQSQPQQPIQQPIQGQPPQPIAKNPACPPAPSCEISFLMGPNSTQTQGQQSGASQTQEEAWQQQAQRTRCHFENPIMANGCLTSCGTLVCEGPVRFLNIVMEQSSAVATWVPPLSAALGQTYTVELSYDNGATWSRVNLQQPWATFVRFPVEQGRAFYFRVAAGGYPPLIRAFNPQTGLFTDVEGMQGQEGLNNETMTASEEQWAEANMTSEEMMLPASEEFFLPENVSDIPASEEMWAENVTMPPVVIAAPASEEMMPASEEMFFDEANATLPVVPIVEPIASEEIANMTEDAYNWASAELASAEQAILNETEALQNATGFA